MVVISNDNGYNILIIIKKVVYYNGNDKIF